jgi:hypothetical protein
MARRGVTAVEWFGVWGSVASIIGLAISVYILRRVHGLTHAKAQERAFMRHVLRVEEIEYCLTSVMEYATAIQTSTGNSDLLNDVASLRGKVAGALETLGEVYDDAVASYPVRLTDYYTSEFISSEVPTAKNLIRIVCYRTVRIASYDCLEAFHERIRHRCRVEILFLSPDTPAPILEDLADRLPFPPESVDALRRQLSDGIQFIAEFARKNLTGAERRRLICKTYTRAPRFHMTQLDERIFLGVPSVVSEMVTYRDEILRPCIVMPRNSALGAYTLENYKRLYSDAIRVRF